MAGFDPSINGRFWSVHRGPASSSSTTANTPQFWLNLQSAYDLAVAERARAGRIERDVHPYEAA
jgi:hypothetical protein